MEQTDNTASRIIDVLSDICETCPRQYHARVVAGIVYKRRLISVGTNNGRSDPWQLRYSKTGHNIWLHAEVQAIKRAFYRIGKERLSKSSLYVCRLVESSDKSEFSRALAKPCAGCQRAIREFGIRHVVYTTGPQSLTFEFF